jgi:hypothetical protein
MKMEQVVFLDSVSFLPFPLRKLPEAFNLTARKSWYPHYFNTEENLDYVGPIPDVSYYGANDMGAADRAEFLAWYEGQRDRVFDNWLVLETYCQDDVTVLRQACQVFSREFMQIGNIDVFQESITIASACNKVLCKRFLKPDTIGLIPKGGYISNIRQSKKALMWLVHRERTDECAILREQMLSELPRLSVDGFCPETRTVYEFMGCYYHGHTCQPFRDVTTAVGDTLAERYERTMARKEQIAGAGYRVEVQWECELDETIPVAELQTHPSMQQTPLKPVTPYTGVGQRP